MIQQINWGIIGCGDVTEVKSGPAFNKVPNSKLVAVMRRDADKAADYAKRHNVPRWYSDADKLINDPEVNAASGQNRQLAPGLDQGAYPRSRFYMLGLELGF